jgi:hypothetical protein
MALGALGVGYAAWTDTVRITGQVLTGDVCVKWIHASNLDPCPCPATDPNTGYYDQFIDPNLNVTAITGDPDGWPTNPYACYYPGKNVACTEVDGVGTDTLTVTVYNGYPLYYNDLEVHFINCGTIPVKITSIVITPLNFNKADAPWGFPNNGPLWVHVTNGVGLQLEPGDEKTASVFFVVQQCAEQGLTGDDAYQFTITWTVTQWDEA